MKKDCMLQFATRREIIEDTDLITIYEAKALWRSRMSKFIELHENGEEPEMVIWVNCKNSSSYRDSMWHIDEGSVVKDGVVYNLVEAGRA